jgi:recombinational DNA repair protein (RecF pathway)
MSYKTYITDALVCGARTRNTSDKSFLLFTREAGMLYASAKSVREERSKQRYALQEFSIVRATLVHGKAGWRITGAESILNVYGVQGTREARALVRNVIRLLRRLIQGEVPHASLYDEVTTLLKREHAGGEGALEEVLTLRVLNMLGYIAPTEEMALLFTSTDIDSLARSLDPKTAEIRADIIKKALIESHL